jgi:osmotically-inducible protein OsmY
MAWGLDAREPVVSPPQVERDVIRAIVRIRLEQSSYRELRGVSCEFHEGVLTLRGRVSSYYLKQVAQTLIRGLDGISQVNNRLSVVPRPHPVRQ